MHHSVSLLFAPNLPPVPSFVGGAVMTYLRLDVISGYQRSNYAARRSCSNHAA